MLFYEVERGFDTGLVLEPHRYRNGKSFYFRASDAKDGPHYQVTREEDLIPHLKQGRAIRMSCKHRPPSLILPASVKGWK
jgi:hypothetical protein